MALVKGSFRIRKATARDLPLLVRHRRAMWEDFLDLPPSTLDKGDSVYRQWLRMRMRRGDAVAFISETSDRVPVASGAVFVRDIDPSPSGVATSPHIISMFTQKEYRGQAIATRILRELASWCKKRGFPAVTLSPAPKARPLYRREGFERAWGMVLRFPNRRQRPHSRRQAHPRSPASRPSG